MAGPWRSFSNKGLKSGPCWEGSLLANYIDGSGWNIEEGSTSNAGLNWRSSPDMLALCPRSLRSHDPYGAPNASPHIERFNRTLRQEALNHFLFLSDRHVLRVCREFVRYYNGARPSQATHAIPDPYPELRTPPTTGRMVALPVLGGIVHDYRRAA